MVSRYMNTAVLPSHKTSLNTTRYRANKGWVPLGIKQANLRNIDSSKTPINLNVWMEKAWGENERYIPLLMQELKDRPRSQGYNQPDS